MATKGNRTNSVKYIFIPGVQAIDDGFNYDYSVYIGETPGDVVGAAQEYGIDTEYGLLYEISNPKLARAKRTSVVEVEYKTKTTRR